jgi:hypothetical protein
MERPQRVMCPRTMAVQMALASSRPIDCSTVQIPTGIRIWETREI